MNKVMCAVLTAVVASAAFAEKASELSDAEYEARHLRRVGGYITKKGTYTGKVVVVNAQSRLSAADCEEVVRQFAAKTEINAAVSGETQDATIVLTVIDDPKEPTLLLAPDDRWGKVNVAKIVDDLPSENARRKFFAARGRKLVIRALCALCGGASSNYPGNVMNAANARELDLCKESYPVDVVARMNDYLPKVGVTKRELVSYRQACREGWAPAPTNDVQKAVWDSVHEMPTDPIRIKFDPKRDK